MDPCIFVRSNLQIEYKVHENNLFDEFTKIAEIKKYYLQDKKYVTKKQYEVLRELSSGKTFKEIARTLKLSPRTVEARLNSAKSLGSKSKLTNLFLQNLVTYVDSEKVN